MTLVPNADRARITKAIFDVEPHAPLFDNVPSDMTWGELVEAVADLLPPSIPAFSDDDVRALIRAAVGAREHGDYPISEQDERRVRAMLDRMVLGP